MSTSLLKKSLKLFEDDEGKRDKSTKNKQTQKVKCANEKSSGRIKKQATLKDRKVKSAFEVFVKKHKKQDRTLENLVLLDKLSQKQPVTKESANKVPHILIDCCYLLLICDNNSDFLISTEEAKESY